VVLSAVLLAVVLFVSVFAVRGRRRRRELELEVAELRKRARVEGLTMLGNGQAFTEALDIEVSRADRTGRPASLLVVSLDSELWRGQSAAGAQEALAKLIRSGLRGADVGYRLGTDEFAMILPETRGQGALVAAERIEANLLAAGGEEGTMTVGIAELGPGIDRHQLFRNAYCALLAAGRDGRSRLLLYSPDLEPASSAGGTENPRLTTR
jgi:diguanylate cyclase (GGDEF)-like protein